MVYFRGKSSDHTENYSIISRHTKQVALRATLLPNKGRFASRYGITTNRHAYPLWLIPQTVGMALTTHGFGSCFSRASPTVHRKDMTDNFPTNLPADIAAALNLPVSGLDRLRDALQHLQRSSPESLMHALQACVQELCAQHSVLQRAGEHFAQAYEAIMGELDSVDLYADPDLWGDLYPVLLWRLKFVLHVLKTNLNLDSYPTVFQKYCATGGKGQLSKDEALTTYARLMGTTKEDLGKDDETVQAVKQLHALRSSVQEVLTGLAEVELEEKKADAPAVLSRFLELFAFEGLMGFQHYNRDGAQ